MFIYLYIPNSTLNTFNMYDVQDCIHVELINYIKYVDYVLFVENNQSIIYTTPTIEGHFVLFKCHIYIYKLLYCCAQVISESF